MKEGTFFHFADLHPFIEEGKINQYRSNRISIRFQSMTLFNATLYSLLVEKQYLHQYVQADGFFYLGILKYCALWCLRLDIVNPFLIHQL